MTQDILFSEQGQLAVVTLNRSSALNALTLEMILELQKHLSLWKKDDAIKAVVIRAVPGNAFCAGGDVRCLYQSSIQEQMEFFWHEYRLNHFIHHLGKPYIALMDGITMGGGVGISLHGSHPIASERFVFAMPETSIGFFPDIGSSHLLTQCPDSLGLYLGLTGNRLGPFDAKYAGLVTQVVHSEKMPIVLDELTHMDLAGNASEQVNRCLEEFAERSPMPELKESKTIKECFSLDSVDNIIAALEQKEEDWALGVSKILKQKSPFSLKLTTIQLQKAQGLSLAKCLEMDFNLVYHFMKDHDFYEGVRALLIDKDKNPQWNPKQLNQVLDSKIQSYFNLAFKPLDFI